MKFQRKPLRDDIRKEILRRIVDGSLPSGTRINETHLAEDLDISRTPLREAMLTLAAGGFLLSDMGRGFAVPEMDPAEMRHIQHMLAMLQPVALEQALPLAPAQLMELSNHLNRARMKLGAQGTGADRGLVLAGLVSQWNDTVLRNCTNPLLVDDIVRLEGLAARYWCAAAGRGLDTPTLLESFGGLYELLRQDLRERACAVWASHIEKFGDLAVRQLQPKAESQA